MSRISWAKGCSLLVRQPDKGGPKPGRFEVMRAEVLLPSPEGWVILPYAVTWADFAATDWSTD